jgi:hypothetical protein
MRINQPPRGFVHIEYVIASIVMTNLFNSVQKGGDNLIVDFCTTPEVRAPN